MVVRYFRSKKYNLRLVNCDTEEQSADIFTKAFGNKDKWQHAIGLIGFGGFRPLSTDRVPKPAKGGNLVQPSSTTIHLDPQQQLQKRDPNHSRRCACAACLDFRAALSATKPPVDEWAGIDRVIIEYCCYENSLMGQKIRESRGCKVIRVTEDHDQTTDAGCNWLLRKIAKIPKHLPILLWGSIPCTGGTPWARFNLRKSTMGCHDI